MASKQHTLRVTIAQPSRDRNNDDFVLLEQDPWEPLVGYITRFGLYQYLNSLLFFKEPPEPKCPTIGPRTVYAYPSRPDLNYRIGCTWGTLGPRRIVELDYHETIQCDLQTELTTKYPPLAITGWEWIGGAWSSEGEPLEHPAVTTDGGKILLSQPVYGTLAVNYRVCRHLYTLAIPSRPGALENTIQSHVYAVWDGGNVVMEIEWPEGLDEGLCNYNHTSGIGDLIDDRRPPDHVDPEDEYIDVDYCTGIPYAE